MCTHISLRPATMRARGERESTHHIGEWLLPLLLICHSTVEWLHPIHSLRICIFVYSCTAAAVSPTHWHRTAHTQSNTTVHIHTNIVRLHHFSAHSLYPISTQLLSLQYKWLIVSCGVCFATLSLCSQVQTVPSVALLIHAFNVCRVNEMKAQRKRESCTTKGLHPLCVHSTSTLCVCAKEKINK